jgi:hypothetical protein
MKFNHYAIREKQSEQKLFGLAVWTWVGWQMECVDTVSPEKEGKRSGRQRALACGKRNNGGLLLCGE